MYGAGSFGIGSLSPTHHPNREPPRPSHNTQMKFRPWGGVYLSEEYLSGVEAADEATRRILDVYREFSGMY